MLRDNFCSEMVWSINNSGLVSAGHKISLQRNRQNLCECWCTPAGLRASLTFVWVISPSSGSSSFFCSPTHVRTSDRLSLATCRPGGNSIDLCLGLGAVLWERGGGDKRVVYYPIGTLSTGFNLNVKEGKKHLKLLLLSQQQRSEPGLHKTEINSRVGCHFPRRC